MITKNYFIFTPENPIIPVQTPKIEEVTQFLRSQGEDAEIINGHYNSPERSIFVHNPKNVKALHALAESFGQESAIHSTNGKHQLHYYHGPNAGKVTHGQGTRFYKEAPEDFYSTIHTKEGPIHFTHNFDDQSLQKAIKPRDVLQPHTGANKGKGFMIVGENSKAYQVRAINDPIITAGGGQAHEAEWDKDRKHQVWPKFHLDFNATDPQAKIPKYNADGEMTGKNKIHPDIKLDDSHFKLPHTDAQKNIALGVNPSKVRSFNGDRSWTSDLTLAGRADNHLGNEVIIKAAMPHEELTPEYKDDTTSHRELYYHNAANVLGLGEHVPKVALAHHNGEHYSVMEFRNDAEHYDRRAHKKDLKAAYANGTIDKLALMNGLLGNVDRHGGNWMMENGKPILIDHGMTLDHTSDWPERTPDYLNEAASVHGVDNWEMPMTEPAKEWLFSLNPKKIHSELQSQGIPEHMSTKIAANLQEAQKLVKRKGDIPTSAILQRLYALHRGKK